MNLKSAKKVTKYCGLIAITMALGIGSAFACSLNSATGTAQRGQLSLMLSPTAKQDSVMPKQCVWEIPEISAPGCNIVRARVEGAGTKPASAISITRNSNDNVALSRSAMGGHGNWYWVGNNLNCSKAGCGTSSYTIVTDDPAIANVCKQRLTLILTTT